MKSYLTLFLITSAVIMLIVHSQTKAQTNWIPDPNFGTGGATRVDFGLSQDDNPSDMILLSDGKILSAGISTASTGYYIAISQLLQNGQPDISGFGTDGEVLLHFVNRDWANDIEIQNDGKILVAGAEATSSAASAITPALYRFFADGSIDTTFANLGRAINRFPGNSSGQLYGIKVLPDGRIWVAGVSTTTRGFGSMRFLPNGQLDINFGTGGMAIMNYSLGYHPIASLFLGDTVLVMATVDISPTNIVLAMMDSSGNPYTAFGNNGIMETDIVSKYNFSGGESLALTSDGKILLGCTTPNSSPTNFTVIRFLIDGSVDSTFGTNGRTDMQFGTDNVLDDMKLDSNGKILLVGEANDQAGLIRLNDDGSPDTTFAPEGKFTINLNENAGTHYLTSVIPQQNGDILAAGYDFASNAGDFMIIRLTQNPTGIDDNNFDQPNDFALYQNYPNPFNPSTKISWQSPVGSHQTLKVYDVLGNEVATLFDEYKEAGTYEVEFNAEGLSSGVYFYRIITDSFIQTKKMILIR